MKEKWTKDLQKKMSNYEVPTIPEGLWEDIDAAIGEMPSKTAKKATLFPHWKKACAAILLLLLIPTTLLFLNNKENEMLVENGSVSYIPQPASPIMPSTPTFPVSSPIVPVNHIATPLAQKVPNTSKPSLILEQSPATQEEEAPTLAPEEKQTEKKQATTPSQTPQSVERAIAPKVPQSEDAPIFKQEKQDGIYLAMNASGINLSSKDWTSPEHPQIRRKFFSERPEHHR